MQKNYYLGGPVWANKDWVGRIYPSHAKPAEYLFYYSRHFNTVEGSTSFYHLPSHSAVARWHDDTPPQFRFSFKFPQNITHQQQLRHAQSEVSVFLRTIEPLFDRIGLLFLQLPPTFDEACLPILRHFLPTLPSDWVYALEVRHLHFYPPYTDYCQRLDELLHQYGVNRAVFDTSALHALQPAATATPNDVQAAQRRKPAMPPYFVATAQRPMLRYVGHPDVAPNTDRLHIIAQQVAAWIAQGRQPFVYFHTPSDYHALHLAQHFHTILATYVGNADIGTAPVFTPEPPPPQQTSLFG